MSRISKVMARTMVLAITATTLYLTLVGSASAAWFVEGSELAGSAALKTTANLDKPIILSSAGLTVECTGNLAASSPEIKASNTLAAAALIFMGCKATTPKTCAVPTTIGTIPITTELTEETEPADKSIAKPSSGKVFTTIHITGEECAAAGNKPVTGDFEALLPEGQEEQAVQLFDLKQGSTGLLKLGTESASFEGRALLLLASSGRWAFFKAGPIATPHWWEGGVEIVKGAELKVKTGTGGGVFSFSDAKSNNAMSCKMEDKGKIVNPLGGGPGEGTIEEPKFVHCASPVCKAAETPELEALKAPWKFVLLARKPAAAEIKKMGLEYKCNGVGVKYVEVAGTPIRLGIFNGAGKGEKACNEPTHTTFFEFEAFTDVLEREGVGNIAQLSGHDCIWGETANEVITIKSS